jgi:hypothetical protein
MTVRAALLLVLASALGTPAVTFADATIFGPHGTYQRFRWPDGDSTTVGPHGETYQEFNWDGASHHHDSGGSLLDDEE